MEHSRQGRNAGSLNYEFRGGSEGPAHDPYHYDEVLIYFRGRKVKLHSGLECYIEIDDDRWEAAGDRDYDNYPYEKFEEVLGFSVKQLERWDLKLKSRCRKCGGKHFYWAHGYPGEELCVCSSCQTINYGDFCMAAII